MRSILLGLLAMLPLSSIAQADPAKAFRTGLYAYLNAHAFYGSAKVVLRGKHPEIAERIIVESDPRYLAAQKIRTTLRGNTVLKVRGDYATVVRVISKARELTVPALDGTREHIFR